MFQQVRCEVSVPEFKFHDFSFVFRFYFMWQQSFFTEGQQYITNNFDQITLGNLSIFSFLICLHNFCLVVLEYNMYYVFKEKHLFFSLYVSSTRIIFLFLFFSPVFYVSSLPNCISQVCSLCRNVQGTGLTHVDPRLVCVLCACSKRQPSTDENPYNWPKPAHMASSSSTLHCQWESGG